MRLKLASSENGPLQMLNMMYASMKPILTNYWVLEVMALWNCSIYKVLVLSEYLKSTQEKSLALNGITSIREKYLVRHMTGKPYKRYLFGRSIKLWDIQGPGNSERTFMHDFVVYQAIWHPTHESIFGSCSGDQTLRVWDIRTGKDVKRIHAH